MTAMDDTSSAPDDEHHQAVKAATDWVLVEWRDVLDRLGRGDGERATGPPRD